MTPADDRLLDRIRKLLALAGNNPNEHEAAAAAERAQALILEHGIDVARLRAADDEGEVGMHTHTGRVDPWRRQLAEAVARSMGGRTVYATEYRKWTGTIDFWGTDGSAEAMAAAYSYLESRLEVLSKLEASKVRHVNAAQSMHWRRSFPAGAVRSISARLDLRRREAVESTGTGRELALRSTAVERVSEEHYRSADGGGLRNTVIKAAYDPGAHGAGKSTGSNLDMGDVKVTPDRRRLGA